MTYGAEFFRWFSEEAVRIHGRYSTAPTGDTRLLTMKEPVGPTLMITPWNFPLAMGTRKIGPAIAAGCTMVVKPAAETPLTMLALAALLERGRPARRRAQRRHHDRLRRGVRADHPRPAAAQAHLHRVDRGRARSSSRSPPTSCCGSRWSSAATRPFIVFDDADLDAAVDGAMLAKMRNIGEACTAANRFLVHESRRRRVRQPARRADGRPDGRRRHRGRRRRRPAHRREGPRRRARARRRRRLRGRPVARRRRRSPTGPGTSTRPRSWSTYPPRRGCSARRSSARSRRSPPSTTEDEAIARANDTEYGLVAYVFTRDHARVLRRQRGAGVRHGRRQHRASSPTPPRRSAASSTPASAARAASRASRSTSRPSTSAAPCEVPRDDGRPVPAGRPARRGGAALRRPAPHLGAAGAGGGRAPAGGRPDAVDDPVAGLVPAVRRVGGGRPLHRRRRHRLRRPLPRRHRLDDRPLPAGGGRGGARAHRARHHHDAPLDRRRLGRRRAQPPLRPAPLADGDDGHRRQPLRAPLRPPPHRPAPDRGDGLVLPRHGRRDARRARARSGGRPGRRAARRARPAGRRRHHHRRGAVQRPRRPRRAARARATSRAC